METGLRPPQKSGPWVVLCLAVAAASLLYRILVLGQVEQTALMFIGLPLVLAIGLSLTPRPRSATGVIMKGMALALLLFGVLLIEGLICILMAAPLFFLIGYIIGWCVDRRRKKDQQWYRDRMRCSVVGVMILMSLEGVSEWLSFDREERVVVEQVVPLTLDEARSRLNQGPDFELSDLPGFLKLGFPLPESIQGSGLSVGDRWILHMAGGEGEPGDLVMEVVESGADHIKLQCIKDDSHIAHWLSWQYVEWRLLKLDGGRCQVRMELHYERELDPAWYFKPAERYGVKKAGEYFLQQTLK